LTDISHEFLTELLRRLHQRADKSDAAIRNLRDEINAMRLNMQAQQSDISNLYNVAHQLDARMERIENRLELREFQEAQARFEPQP
jgi:ubiquitin C-terminal hydrolase